MNSLGVIGGADGPTAVFVTGDPSSAAMLLAFLSVAAAYFVFSRRQGKGFDTFLKVFTALFCSIGFFRLMLSDSFVFVINGGYYDNVFYDSSDVPQALLRWGYYLNYSVLPMAVFFNSRLFRNVASYVCLPFVLRF